MTARFGRNKRRAAREAIAAAEMRVQFAETEARRLRYRMEEAQLEGVRRYLNDPEKIDNAMRLISQRLSEMLPPNIAPYAEKLMKAEVRHDRRAEQPIRFDAHIPYDQTVEMIHIIGHIDLKFATVVARL